MARVTLDRDECSEGFLPPVCARCGEPATGTRSHDFLWHQPIIFFALICCFPLYVVLALVNRKRMNVALPVCDRHRGMWVRRQVALVAGVVSMFAGVSFGAAFGQEIDRVLNFDSTAPIAVFGGVLAGVFLIAIAGLGSIRPTRISAESITLAGVSPVFADTVEQYRILLEDDDE